MQDDVAAIAMLMLMRYIDAASRLITSAISPLLLPLFARRFFAASIFFSLLRQRRCFRYFRCLHATALPTVPLAFFHEPMLLLISSRFAFAAFDASSRFSCRYLFIFSPH